MREHVWVFEQDLLDPDGTKASRIPASDLKIIDGLDTLSFTWLLTE
jgi:hypothetical protein